MSDSPSTFNLIHEPWLPLCRRSGAIEWAAPWQITDDIDGDPFVAIAVPRADFVGSLTEFLIGLMSTAAAPPNDRDWRRLGLEPPSPEHLRTRFSTIAHAFDLDGPGPRFMQDLDPDLGGETREVGALLIDAPGDNTLRKNTDIFVKRGGVSALCRSAAAMALYTLQTYAPSGGTGHRTSLRGGGPLTTLVVLGDRLWDRIWPNVETLERIAARQVGEGHGTAADIFPWLAPTRTSAKSGPATTAADAHPLQAYWGMPRRVRLEFAAADGDRCALLDHNDPVLVRGFRTRNLGVNYTEGWQHPLSPYYRAKTGGPLLPVHGQPGNVGYRHWLGLVMEDADRGRIPAACVRHVLQQPYRIRAGNLRLWAFGFDLDNMKARSWIDSEIPLHELDDPDLRERVQSHATALVRSADAAASALTMAVKKAWFQTPGSARGDFGFIAERFWRLTEAEFKASVHAIRRRADRDDAPEDPGAALREDWRAAIDRAAQGVFDDLVPTQGLEHAAMERLVTARFDLTATLRGGGKLGARLFQHLSLLTPQQHKARANAQGAAA